MSFKLFIYYCAICGGWAALVGWALGQVLAPSPESQLLAGWVLRMLRALLQGTSLGVTVAFGLGLVDALWNLSARRLSAVALRVGVVSLVGCLSGLLGAAIGQGLVLITRLDPLLIFGWTLTGLLIGASIGFYDIAASVFQGGRMGGALRKIVNGLLGGALGGLLGGILFFAIRLALGLLLRKAPDELKSSSAWGFVALGLCIGLFIGLAQVILKEAWVRIEAGFRAGREMILTKDVITIGRAESCDIGMFGDAGIERLHARILLQGDGYLLADAGSASGTLLNGQPVTQPTPLRSGDRIKLGNSVLCFGERPKAGKRD